MKNLEYYKPASAVVRAAADRLGKYGTMVFNDRLKDGGRSYKVWGADKKFYVPIKRKLEKLGYSVTYKNIGNNRWRLDNRDCYRIHVR